MQPTFLALLSLAHAGTISVGIHQQRDPSSRGRGDSITTENYHKNFYKRALTDLPESLANGFYSYAATLRIGSNSQVVTPSVDTGSSDLWVMTSSNPYCGSSQYFDCTGQTFDPTTSTTFQNLSRPWDIQYLDTTGAFGYLAEDNIAFDGGAVVKDAQFAVAGVANSSSDVFGIGFTSNEASMFYYANGTTGGYQYPNLPLSMKQQGLISRISYSLFLNDISAREGQVLFGGIDRSQYDGTLSIVPMIQIYRSINTIIDFRIMLDGINIKTGDQSCELIDFALPFLLDSGTSYALMPQAIIDQMAKAMNYTTTNGPFYQGNCDGPFEFDSFELNFSGTKLQVPPATLLDYVTDQNNNVISINGQKQCILAISNEDDLANYILGDVFLRNFYVVYDLEGYQVAIAQAKYASGTPDIAEISTGIPDATTAPAYSSTAFRRQMTTANYAQCLTTPSSSVASSSVASSSVRSSSVASSSIASSSAASSSSSVASSSIASSSAASSSVASSSVASSSSPVSSSSVAASSSTSSSSPSSSSVYLNSTAAATSSASSSSLSSAVVTTISTPTTLSANGQTYTITDSTVLTLTDCGCTETTESSTPATSAVAASTTSAAAGHDVYVTTTVVDTFITTCATPTVFSTNGQTYTVTESTVITVTDCPCTLTHSVPVESQVAVETEAASSSTPSTPLAAIASTSVNTPISSSLTPASTSTPVAVVPAAISAVSAGSAAGPVETASASTASAATASASSAVPSVPTAAGPALAVAATSAPLLLANAAHRLTASCGLLLGAIALLL